jgi:hypothetical protein
MAKGYPNSTFVGFDCHDRSTAWARTAAGGFGRFVGAAETPFNLVYEGRP